MCKMHSEKFAKELQTFEEELYSQFKEKFDLNFSFYRNLSNAIDEKMNEIKPKSDFEWSVNYLFYRSYKLYWTILILCQRGFAPEAGILLRSLMEQVVNMEWIAVEDSDHRAELFLEYFHIARKRLYDLYSKHNVLPKLTKTQKESMEDIEEIEKCYEEVKHIFKDERYWAPERIRSRAEKVGAGYDFDFYYWYYSFLAHSNSACQSEYVRKHQLTDIFIIGPNYSMIEDVLHLAYKYMLLAFYRWNIVFKLGLDNLMIDLFAKLEEMSIVREDIQPSPQL